MIFAAVLSGLFTLAGLIGFILWVTCYGQFQVISWGGQNENMINKYFVWSLLRPFCQPFASELDSKSPKLCQNWGFFSKNFLITWTHFKINWKQQNLRTIGYIFYFFFICHVTKVVPALNFLLQYSNVLPKVKRTFGKKQTNKQKKSCCSSVFEKINSRVSSATVAASVVDWLALESPLPSAPLQII